MRQLPSIMLAEDAVSLIALIPRIGQLMFAENADLHIRIHPQGWPLAGLGSAWGVRRKDQAGGLNSSRSWRFSTLPMDERGS